MRFNPCRGGDFCTQEGSHCEGCGRSHEEIAATRELIAAVGQFALDREFENVEDFAAYVADKAVKKVQMVRSEEQGGGIPIGVNISLDK